MGNRATIILEDDEMFSPAIYLHWAGEDALRYIDEWRDLMDPRRNDISYGFARLVGICHNDIPGELSLGVLLEDGFPQEADRKECFKKYDHGDSGVFLLNVITFHVTRYINGHQWQGRGESYGKQNAWLYDKGSKICSNCGIDLNEDNVLTKELNNKCLECCLVSNNSETRAAALNLLRTL